MGGEKGGSCTFEGEGEGGLREANSGIRLAGGLNAHRGTAEIREQFRRSSSSCALNIAEASGKAGADRRRFFMIARGSESAAALDVLAALGAVNSDVYMKGLHLCDRLYSMLNRLT